MADLAKGMWLLPSLNRPASLAKVFAAMKAMGTQTKGAVIVDRADWKKNNAAYKTLERELPFGWSYKLTKGVTMGDKVREAWPLYKDAEWVGLFGDDNIPETPNWDAICVSHLTGWNIISTNDGLRAPTKMAGGTCWSGDLIRAVGYLYPPNLQHLYIDDIWEQLGIETASWDVIMGVMVRHNHASATGEKDSTFEKINAPESWKTDQRVFNAWLVEQKEKAKSAIVAMKRSRDIITKSFDFRGKHIMLATPTASARPELSYVTSYLATLKAFGNWGARVDYIAEKYNSDICLARTRLFGTFYRSNAEWLLMIDDDMDWTPEDIVRLFVADKEYCAVAGPKKLYPITCAFYNRDENDQEMPVIKDPETGVARVEMVGAAFCLIHRSCADKMVQAYGESLGYMNDRGENEYMLYQPTRMTLANGRKRYLPEDYAFCYRWRQIGGEVFVVPDVALGHTGSHRFQGAIFGGGVIPDESYRNQM